MQSLKSLRKSLFRVVRSPDHFGKLLQLLCVASASGERTGDYVCFFALAVQIAKMKEKLESWCADVNSMEGTIAQKAKDILT